MNGGHVCARLGCGQTQDIVWFVVNGPLPHGTKASTRVDGQIGLCEKCAFEIPSENRCEICAQRTVYACFFLGATACCDACAASMADYARTARVGDLRLTSEFRSWLDVFGMSSRIRTPSFYDRQAGLLVESYKRDMDVRLSNHELFTIRANARLRELGCPFELAAAIVRVLGPEQVPPDWVTLAQCLVNKIGS